MQRVIGAPVAIAALAVAGIGIVAAKPTTVDSPSVRHAEIRLVDEQGLGQVLIAAGENLHDEFIGAGTAFGDLSHVVGGQLTTAGSEVFNAVVGPLEGIKNALYGGWYGDDDGYVFGLFGGTVYNDDGVPMTGSTLAEVSAFLGKGDVFDAYATLDAYTLEATDHTLFPLLAPFITEFNDDTGQTTLSIPGQLLQDATNVYNSFVSYTDLKEVSNAFLAPIISFQAGLTYDLTSIGTEFSSGDHSAAFSDLLKLPTDLLGDVLNGFTDPNVPGDTPFTGLLNGGSLLDDLLVVWPTQLATALGETTTSSATESIAAALPDLATAF